MKAIMKVLDGEMYEKMGIDEESETTVYFDLFSVKGAFRYEDTMIINVSGVEYYLVYDKELWRKIKDQVHIDPGEF